jgi:hypothetical protein
MAASDVRERPFKLFERPTGSGALGTGLVI